MFYSKKLKKFNKISHCFFSRKNGFSKGLYKGLNCGRGSKDNKKNIRKNLDFVSRKMFVNKKKLVLMHQTHSNKVIEIKKNNYKKKIYSDAIITKEKGFALGVVTADCVPILLYDKKNEVVGCIHAGWRGAFLGIIKNTILKIKNLTRTIKSTRVQGHVQEIEAMKLIWSFLRNLNQNQKNIKNTSLTKIKVENFLI